jgi:hypothetical protein
MSIKIKDYSKQIARILKTLLILENPLPWNIGKLCYDGEHHNSHKD